MKLLSKIVLIFKKLKKEFVIIDYILLIIILFSVIFFFFYLKRQNRYINITVKVTDDDVLYAYTDPNDFYANSFIVGDGEKNILGKNIIRIDQIRTYQTEENKKAVYLDLQIEANYDPKRDQYYFRGQPLIYGQSILFSFSQVRFHALVVDFPNFQDQSQEYKIKVKAQLRSNDLKSPDVYGVPDYVANAIRPGDQIIDSQNQVIAQILDVDIQAAKRTVITDHGQVFLVNDPQLKDVYYLLELQVRDIQGRRYFNQDQEIIIGKVIPLNFPNITIYLTITEILE